MGLRLPFEWGGYRAAEPPPPIQGIIPTMAKSNPPPEPEPDPPRSSLVLYVTEDGRSRIECRFEGDTIWLTQALIAELVQTTPQNITIHLKALYAERALDEAATCKECLQVRSEGGREVSRALRHYNLDAILAIGYRVRSSRGTQFRRGHPRQRAAHVSARA